MVSEQSEMIQRIDANTYVFSPSLYGYIYKRMCACHGRAVS
jgi:hypothetical protein